MTLITEGKQDGEFIRLATPLSFDEVTIRIGEVLVPGQVVGKLASGGQYGALEEAATHGLATAVAINFAHVDTTTAAAQATVVSRAAEVVGNRLTWPSTYNAADKAAAEVLLAVKNLIVRY